MPGAAPDPSLELFPPTTRATRGWSALGGLGCAALILGALSLSRAPGDDAPEADIYVARQVALPVEVPPPPGEPVPAHAAPLASPIRLEIAAAASPVHIQVLDIPLLAMERTPPVARPTVAARFDLARSAARPLQESAETDTRRIFDRHEVDQRPMVLQRVQPPLSFTKVRAMATPRTTMLLVVNTDGTVGEVRLLASSQDDDFDQIMMATIREWRFSPAVRKGRKVRCWVEQAVTVRVDHGSRFEAH